MITDPDHLPVRVTVPEPGGFLTPSLGEDEFLTMLVHKVA